MKTLLILILLITTEGWSAGQRPADHNAGETPAVHTPADHNAGETPAVHTPAIHMPAVHTPCAGAFHIDPAYIETAARSGGQILMLDPSEAAKSMALVESTLQGNEETILRTSGELPS